MVATDAVAITHTAATSPMVATATVTAAAAITLTAAAARAAALRAAAVAHTPATAVATSGAAAAAYVASSTTGCDCPFACPLPILRLVLPSHCRPLHLGSLFIDLLPRDWLGGCLRLNWCHHHHIQVHCPHL